MISRPVRNRKTSLCSTHQSLSDQGPVNREFRGAIRQGYYWIPRGIVCSFVVFVLLFWSAEAASGKVYAKASINTNSLLTANYDKWEQPIEVCILPDIMKVLRADGGNALKENDSPYPDESGGEFLIDHPEIEVPDADAGAKSDFGKEDQSEVLPTPALLSSEGDQETAILPDEPAGEELHGLTGIPELDEEISITEVRETIRELQESIRSEREGGSNLIDPELIEQVRELQEIRNQLDLPDVSRFP
jgi:hypothetical protein